jgi:DNA-binding transcriptional regulator GbsR (MarR family)
MLPNLYYQCYQKLSELLKSLQQTAIASEVETPKLRQDVLAAQQYFQQQIASLDPQEIHPTVESRVRSLSTEISKQLNLLNMDVTFLQAARQPQTVQTRQQQIVQRLQTLLGYCEAILVLDKGDNTEVVSPKS